ncbi:MAG: winged helix-turn-helix domain-containing protein [Rudaea sp.]|nr:winged helix-turn-helix domain-containing protein [Rudaea sp.]
MAIPGYQSWMTPLLARLRDGADHRISDLYELLADDLRLSESDRSERLASGVQPVYINRIGWARTYLKKAGVIDQSVGGMMRVSDRGRDASRSGKPIDLD